MTYPSDPRDPSALRPDDDVWPPAHAVWSSRGGPAGGPVLGGVILSVLGGLVGGGAVITSAPADGSRWLGLAVLAAGLFPVVPWLLPGLRSTWALTPTALVQRRLFRRPRLFPLADLRAVRRDRRMRSVSSFTPRVRWRRSPVAEVFGALLLAYAVPAASDRLTLVLDGRLPVGIGPIVDIEELRALLDGYLTGRVRLEALPPLVGGPSQAERREDLFFATESWWDHDAYGPVLVGPTHFVRFTSPLRDHETNEVMTLVDAGTTARAVESSVLAWIDAHVDHTTTLARADLTFAIDAGGFTAMGPARSVRVDLTSERAAHALRLLSKGGSAAWNPASSDAAAKV